MRVQSKWFALARIPKQHVRVYCSSKKIIFQKHFHVPQHSKFFHKQWVTWGYIDNGIFMIEIITDYESTQKVLLNDTKLATHSDEISFQEFPKVGNFPTLKVKKDNFPSEFWENFNGSVRFKQFSRKKFFTSICDIMFENLNTLAD